MSNFVDCKPKFAAVIIAAGYSSRMKSYKPLLKVGEKTAIERLIETVKNAEISDVVVVSGYNREQLMPFIKDADEVYNRQYDSGMFSSIKTGLRYVRKNYKHGAGVFLIPVDCPLISKNLLEKMMETIVEMSKPDCFYVPVYEGKKGHPLFIPYCIIDEICNYDGPGGLKKITDRYWDKMIRIPVDEEGCLMDMDTPEGYREIVDFLAEGCTREPLKDLAKGRRLFLIRHGETMQHDEKMFIGNYDVPLDEIKKSNIKRMAKNLLEDMEKNIPEVIYTSPLQRARHTAQIVKETWLEFMPEADADSINIEIIDDLRELNLGPWDGKPISEIKSKYPEEYNRRGKDIFSFKIGNGAENFYDVQYRSVKALRNILKNDKNDTVIIVSHSTVIRALENNFNGKKIDDLWEKVEKNEYVFVQK